MQSFKREGKTKTLMSAALTPWASSVHEYSQMLIQFINILYPSISIQGSSWGLAAIPGQTYSLSHPSKGSSSPNQEAGMAISVVAQ